MSDPIPDPSPGPGPPPSVELSVVVRTFESRESSGLLAALSKYVVLSRGHPGCRNIDLCASALTEPGEPVRVTIIQKWESSSDRESHLASATTAEMARATRALLSTEPRFDLLEPIPAHDLA